ncbi:MAG: phenylacetate-CoA oxygenase subunit PaaI, partial [Pseudomonadota bacterium]|nr:phenylacetate-CoA oxygenase subunit PaaI [Pseudomonadota bacterium]
MALDGRDPVQVDDALRPALFDWLCRLGDNALILGHRTSEWCGH